MKTTDLMIGDWVISKDLKVPVKVRSIMNHYYGTSIYFYHNGSEFIVQDFQIEPIPLTSEILEKNGFKKKVWREYSEPDVTTYAIGGGFFIEVTMDEYWLVDNCSDSNDYYYTSNWIVKVEYVHKLQHLMRDLEIKKEIIL